ncbi:unnamed protein product, partial [Allacma fusca]
MNPWIKHSVSRYWKVCVCGWILAWGSWLCTNRFRFTLKELSLTKNFPVD